MVIIIILSLDQAKTCGFSLWRDGQLLHYGIINPKHTDYNDVINEMCDKVGNIITKNNVDTVLLEEVQSQRNPASFKKLSMLLGALMYTCHLNECDFEIISCNRWRMELGTRSKKRDELKKLSQEYVLNKYNINVSNDISDSIVMHCYYYNNLEQVSN